MLDLCLKSSFALALILRHGFGLCGLDQHADGVRVFGFGSLFKEPALLLEFSDSLLVVLCLLDLHLKFVNLFQVSFVGLLVF